MQRAKEEEGRGGERRKEIKGTTGSLRTGVIFERSSMARTTQKKTNPCCIGAHRRLQMFKKGQARWITLSNVFCHINNLG
jgi:hypothetical protein